MHIRFLLGPAGSGKTFRCLAEIREALLTAPEGPPLLLLAPRQATFQLERQLLADSALSGYTRLQILSFERLAEFILGEFAGATRVLQEPGRVMVLRALLGRNQSKLKIFPATARLPGFAQQLNLLLREFQRQQFTPAQIAALAEGTRSHPTLSGKLHDAALLLEAYLDWLQTHGLHDANSRLDLAAAILRKTAGPGSAPLRVAGLWLDGFAEMTPQELDLLAAFLPICDRAALAFCVDPETPETTSWLSGWSLVNRTFQNCRERAAALPGARIEIEALKRHPDRGRFAGNPVLTDLEREISHFEFRVVRPSTTNSPSPRSEAREEGRGEGSSETAGTFNIQHSTPNAQGSRVPTSISRNEPPHVGCRKPVSAHESIRLVTCSDPEAEAVLAAREILRFVRNGGRFRETAVLLRRLDGYDHALRRVFLRYQIPFFLDRRESVAHHPLAELTRYALRLAAFGWQHDDWFGALKTGLATDDEAAVDRLENEALARGWQGNTWLQPMTVADDPALEQSINRWLKSTLPPFIQWHAALVSPQRSPSARQLAAAVRELWKQLDVEKTLEQWSTGALQSHLTVLDQIVHWLENLELAFGDESLPLAEWLPILEAGLANLSVGVIPPALDQVLIGAIDRSRNPELKLAVLPGWNESIFPAPPQPGPLLTEAERDLLADRNVRLDPGRLQQIGHERYYAYIACTRARERLVVTCATRDPEGQPLNPSPFFDQLRQITGVAAGTFDGTTDWRESEHACELAAPLLRAQTGSQTSLRSLGELPALAPIVGQWRTVQAAAGGTRLSAAAAEKLYGRELHSSVSGLEDFAACPFKFFAGRGLRLEERKEFQFDDRDKGSFQHEVLREFHVRVRNSGRRWRDLSVAEARQLMRDIGRELLPGFGGGRFLADGAARFMGELLIERLVRLIAVLIEWLPQYQFDPELVEVSFGLDPDGLPAWRIELPDQHALVLRGRIDRVDLCRSGDETFAVVIDYKSSVRALSPLKLHHGLELQLLSYLGVLRHLKEPEKFFHVKQLAPAGVFYVPLNGGNAPAKTRADILGGGDGARRAAYQHSGRFLADALPRFDNRGQPRGDQFKFARNKDGRLRATGNDALPAQEFEALRLKVEGHLRACGTRIFEGDAEVSPFRMGRQTACDRCDFRAGCRFDSWTQPYRELRAPARSRGEAEAR